MLMASVTIGLFLALTGLYALSQRVQYATRVRNYMHTRPERDWHPRWFFKKHVPSERIMQISVTLFFLYCVIAGIFFIIRSVAA